MFNTDHLHPMIVHFPIALITVGLLAEVVSLFFKNEKCLSKTGFYLMILGSLGAIAAWCPDICSLQHPTQGEIVKVFINHETGGLDYNDPHYCRQSSGSGLWLKKKEDTPFKMDSLRILCSGFAAVSFTGFMGGKMVYDFMIGLG